MIFLINNEVIKTVINQHFYLPYLLYKRLLFKNWDNSINFFFDLFKFIFNENTDIRNKKILDSILDDDDEQFSQLISQLLIIDSDLNY